MRAKMKLNLLRYKSIVAALFPRIVLILLASVVLHGCIRVSMVGLPEEVETAVKRSAFRHKAEVVGKVRASVDSFAAAQLQQFNAAEQEYGNEVRFYGLPDPNPMFLGMLFKTKRVFQYYEIVDVRDTGSLLHDPYEVTVGYKYEVLQTRTRMSGEPASAAKVQEDSDFLKTHEQGSLEFLYRFNADLAWDGRPGIRLLAAPVLPPLATTSFVPSATTVPEPSPPVQGVPGPSPPVQDLPVTITPIGGGSGPPPSFLEEGIRSSPLLKKLPRGERSPD